MTNIHGNKYYLLLDYGYKTTNNFCKEWYLYLLRGVEVKQVLFFYICFYYIVQGYDYTHQYNIIQKLSIIKVHSNTKSYKIKDFTGIYLFSIQKYEICSDEIPNEINVNLGGMKSIPEPQMVSICAKKQF